MARRARRKYFRFSVLEKEAEPGLRSGDRGPDIHQLQTFLTSTGYLGRDREPGRFCRRTGAALEQYQLNYRLDPTGEADEETLRLFTVAIHEVGHLLGLGHSQDPSAVMFSRYSSGKEQLTQEDIQAIQTIYGT